MKFLISVEETLRRTIWVEAGSSYEAIEKVENAYDNEDIVLDSSDFVEKDIYSLRTVDIDENNSAYRNLDEFVRKG